MSQVEYAPLGLYRLENGTDGNWTVRLLFGHFAYWTLRLRDISPTAWTVRLQILHI